MQTIHNVSMLASWIHQLVLLLDDQEVAVHAAWEAFDCFVKSVAKDELEPLVVPLDGPFLVSTSRKVFHQRYQSLLLGSQQVARPT